MTTPFPTGSNVGRAYKDIGSYYSSQTKDPIAGEAMAKVITSALDDFSGAYQNRWKESMKAEWARGESLKNTGLPIQLSSRLNDLSSYAKTLSDRIKASEMDQLYIKSGQSAADTKDLGDALKEIDDILAYQKTVIEFQQRGTRIPTYRDFLLQRP